MKVDNSNIDSKPVDYAKVHWFMDRNARKTSFRNPLSDLTYKVEIEGGEEKASGLTGDGLVYQLRNGWDVSQGAIKCVAATAADKKAAIADRERQIKEWERNPNTQPLAIVAKDVWFPKGKPVDVEWIANETYRRSRGVLGVIVRRAMDADYKAYDTSYAVPIVSVSFADARERLLSHLRENSGKDAGRSPLSEVDIFFAAKELLALNPGKAKEADLVKIGFKRGQAVKCFALALFDKQFPNLKIAERVLQGAMPRDKEQAFVYSASSPLPMSKIKHDRLQKMKNGFAYNETRNEEKYKLRGGLQAKHVEQYFADVLSSAEAARTVMKADEILTALSRSPVDLFRWLADEIRQANRDCFGVIEAQADKVNKGLAFLDLSPPDAEEEEEEADVAEGAKIVSKSDAKKGATALAAK